MSNGYQTTLFSKLDPPTDLDPCAVLISDPRWQTCLTELSTCKYIGLDCEFFEANKGPWGKAKDIDYWKSAIRLIQVGLPSGLVLVFNLGGLLDNREELLSAHSEALKILKKVVESKTVPKIGMNLSTEYLLLRIHLDMAMRMTRDIMLLSQIYYAGVGSKKGFFGQNGFVKQPRLKHSMEAIAGRLGIPVDKKEQQSDWAGILTNAQLSYAARDAIVPIKCFQKLGKMLKDDGLLKTAEAECSAQPAFCECSYNGLPVDMDQARADLKVWEQVRDQFFAPFKALFPDVNPLSPKQVASVLSSALDVYTCSQCAAEYDPLKAEPKGMPMFRLPEDWRCDCGAEKRAYTRTGRRNFIKDNGQPSTADDVLAQYSSVWYVNALLEGRSTGTCMNWLRAVVENARDEGDGYRIRVSFRQIAGAEDEAGKGMGRSSASKPVNTQNPSNLQPNHERASAPSVRRSIKPAKGDAFIVADLSQAHGRIAAQWSQDPVMLAAFRRYEDYHLAMTARLLEIDGHNINLEQASEIISNPKHELYKEFKSRRQGCKSTNYAKLNLSSFKTLRKQMETMAVPVFMSDEEAQKLIAVWNDLYCVLYAAQKDHVKRVNSYSHTFHHLGLEGEYGESRALTGRRLFLIKEWQPPRQWPDGKWSNGRWSVKATDAVSSVWMSTESDVIKHAMGLLVDDVDANPQWGFKWSNMCHDEIDATCKKEYALDVAKQLQKRMNEAMIWAGIVDLPTEEKNFNPASCIKANWSAK